MPHNHPYHVFDAEGNYSGFYASGTSSKTENDLVSVVVPIYNASDYLDQALLSIENQTYKNLEIICLNDGSTDESLEIVRKHAEQDPRIVIIDKQNEGYGATCNRGIDEAHGEWIAIVEPDDWILPGMYESMVSEAALWGGADVIDLVKTPYWRIMHADTPQEQQLPCSYKKRMRGTHKPFTIAEAPALIRHHPSIWSAIYSRRFLNDKNIRFKPIPGAGWADNPFLAETMLQASKIAYFDEAFYCYRADTEEEERAFHLRNPELPIERWLDMCDVVERIGVTDENILRTHYERGFMYIGGVLESYTPENEQIHDRLHDVFSRMDPAIVFNDNAISPAAKRLYADILGIEAPKSNHVGHVKYLLERSAYNLGNVGPREFAASTWRYVTKYHKRAGGR